MGMELELNAGAWLSCIEWRAMVVGRRHLQSVNPGPLQCLVPKYEDSSSSPGIQVKSAVNGHPSAAEVESDEPLRWLRGPGN